MGPIDYSIDVQSPFAAAAQGYQLGMGMREDQAKMQQQEAALQQAAQQRQVLQALISNPQAGAQEYANATLLVPGLREQFKQSWDMKNTDQQQAALRDAGQWYAAVRNGKSDVAVTQMKERADLMEASGAPKREVEALRANAQAIEAHPEFGRTTLGLMLASLPGGDKLLANEAVLGGQQRAEEKAPSELARAQAEASKAGAEATTAQAKAKYADSDALLDIEKKGWDITKIKSDIQIAKESNRIAAMNAAVAREGNDLKREELKLKIQDAKDARDTKIRDKVATAEAGAANIDNMLNTVERIKTNKSLNDVLGSLEGRMPAAASMLDDEESDAIALIETLGSQAFLAQIPNIKGMGALSNAEGEKLQSALQNLNRSQSEKQFRANLDEASRLLKKGRENLSRSTGVPLAKPDTPASPGTRPPLSTFITP